MKKLLLFSLVLLCCCKQKSKELIRLEHVRDSIHDAGILIDKELKEKEKALGYDADSIMRKIKPHQ